MSREVDAECGTVDGNLPESPGARRVFNKGSRAWLGRFSFGGDESEAYREGYDGIDWGRGEPENGQVVKNYRGLKCRRIRTYP